VLGTRGDVDLPLAGQRHKVLRNGLSVPPRLTIANLINMAMKPKWCLEMLRARRRIFGNLVVFDDALVGAGCRKDDLNMLQAVSPCAVIRVNSGIKLLQGGLELANVRLAEAFIRKALSLAYELFGIRWPVAVLARSSAKPDLDLESPLADDAPARLERAEDNEQRGLLLDGLGDRERGPVQARLVRLE
jgi:hypothetical protein